MKTLELNGKRLPVVFKANFIENNHLLDAWIFTNLSIFELNEEWSCSVDIEEDKIIISGDEDLIEVDIVDVDVLNFEI